MGRLFVYRLGVVLVLALVFGLLWSLAYEVAVALRWAPSRFPGEGGSRWALLRAQNADRSLGGLRIAFDHLRDRLAYPPTRGEALLRVGLAAAGVAALGLGCWLYAVVNRRQMPFGSARFGTLMEAAKRRLTGKQGIVLGTLGGVTIRSDEPAHVLVVGPSRSGKGTGFVLPNGYLWPGSAVFFDPKRENFAALANHRRAMGNQVFMFSPGSNDTHRYNPLDFVRRDERMATDCLVVASFVIPEKADDTWTGAGRLLLSALIGYVLASPLTQHAQHMRTVARMTTTGRDISAVLKAIVKTERAHLPAWVTDGFNQYVALEPETRNSAMFNINMALSLWNNGLIAAATSASDFDIRELRRRPTSIFIGCTIAELAVFRPLIRILFQQIHDLMMVRLPGPDEPHQVLLMLDEFYHVGRMDSLISKITISAGYGFRMAIVMQDIAQLDELYGKSTRITAVSGSQIKLFIQINDLETSEFVSEMLGETTQIYKTPVVRPGEGIFAARGWAPHYTPRPLRSPLELREMSERTAILMVKNSRSFELLKIRHYRDRPYCRFAKAETGEGFQLPLLETWRDEPLEGAIGSSAVVTDGAEARKPSITTANDILKNEDEIPIEDGGAMLNVVPGKSAAALLPAGVPKSSTMPARSKRRSKLALGPEPLAPKGETCNIRDILGASEVTQDRAFEEVMRFANERNDHRLREAAETLRVLQTQFGDDGS